MTKEREGEEAGKGKGAQDTTPPTPYPPHPLPAAPRYPASARSYRPLHLGRTRLPVLHSISGLECKGRHSPPPPFFPTSPRSPNFTHLTLSLQPKNRPTSTRNYHLLQAVPSPPRFALLIFRRTTSVRLSPWPSPEGRGGGRRGTRRPS